VSDQISFLYRPRKGGGAGEILKVGVRPPSPKPPVAMSAQPSASTKPVLRLVGTAYMKKADSDDQFQAILPEPDGTPCPGAETDLKTLLYASLDKQKRIKPEENGRICTDDSSRRPCRADQWVK